MHEQLCSSPPDVRRGTSIIPVNNVAILENNCTACKWGVGSSHSTPSRHEILPGVLVPSVQNTLISVMLFCINL